MILEEAANSAEAGKPFVNHGRPMVTAFARGEFAKISKRSL